MKKSLVLLLAIFLLVGCASDDTPPSEEKPSTPKEVGVNDTVEVKDYNFTVNGVRTTDGDSLSKAEEGKQWIFIDVTIENKSTEELAVSSLLSFKLKDGDGRDQDFVFTIDLDGQMDGSVLAGEKMSGEVAFSVAPEGELNLYYSKDLLDSSPTKVKVR